ncbi:MAG: HAMP domain-containing sensor histidine kinase, partial [Ignavibacteria bacterium]|nr:HAMP domain-containing sensor histidine kinase [Ignavibacteria bacterium]
AVLSHCQIKDNVFVEIHILSDEKENTWVFLVDQTREIEILQPFLQYHNEERLTSITDRRQSSTKGTLAALYLLDYLSFERIDDDYRMLGQAPSWFDNINGKLHFMDKRVKLAETFPYIEVFYYEAVEIWTANEDGKVISGIWEENTNDNERVYLQALALKHEKRNYLLIKPLNLQTNFNESLYQKAREQKLTLDQLASTERKLKQLLEFKNQFVSIISHDLRSPIGAVIGLANLLLSDNQLTENINAEHLELLTDIKTEMYRLLDYNDKLYQWSNLELGNFKVLRKEIDPLDLISYLEKMQLANMLQKNINFEIDYPVPFIIHADETLLGQALNNLIGNSVKFTSDGGTIKLCFVQNQIGNAIIIEDNGIGMDQETSEKLFAGFMRKTTSGTMGEKGTGLGIGIAKKILDAHGFTIEVNSTLGKGSIFTIRLNE